jgi:hypothetical protein
MPYILLFCSSASYCQYVFSKRLATVDDRVFAVAAAWVDYVTAAQTVVNIRRRPKMNYSTSYITSCVDSTVCSAYWQSHARNFVIITMKSCLLHF